MFLVHAQSDSAFSRNCAASTLTCFELCRYELFIDDLPVWGFVGPPPEETKDEEHIYLYTHKSFDINYNDNRVRSEARSPS